MKKLQAFLFLATALVAGAAEYDMQKTLDLTGLTSVTASQLNQLVDTAITGTNKGMIYRKTTRPDVTTNTRMTNFLWLDVSSDPAQLKSYVCCGDSDTNWIVATIGAASVSSSHLQTASVTAGKLAANSVNTSNLVDSAVTDAKLSAGAVTTNKIAAGAVGTDHHFDRSITGTKIAYNTIVDTNIADTAINTRHLGSSSVTLAKMAAASVDTNKMVGSGTVNQFLMTDSVSGNTVLASSRIITTKYDTNAITIPTSNVATTNSHTLGFIPHIVSIRLVCNSAELGYNGGDEIPIECVIANNATETPVLSVALTTTSFIITPAGTASWQVRDKQGVTYTAITKGNWRLRVYLIHLAGP